MMAINKIKAISLCKDETLIIFKEILSVALHLLFQICNLKMGCLQMNQTLAMKAILIDLLINL